MKVYELIQRVKDIALISGTDRDTAILANLRLAEWQLYNQHYCWRSLQANIDLTTVASQQYLDIPSDMGLIYSVRQTSHTPYRKLTYIAPQKFHFVVPQPTLYAKTKPTHYSLWGGKFWLFPIPDDAYTLTVYYYKRPTTLKVYSTGTAAVSGTAVTGTNTAFKDNNNVTSGMYFTFQADTDGISYAWTKISSVNSNTSLTLESSYGGATSSGSYICSSEPVFPAEFDLVLIYYAAIIECGRNRELQGMTKFLTDQYNATLAGLINSQLIVPDYVPEADVFAPVETVIGVEHHKFPFIKENP